MWAPPDIRYTWIKLSQPLQGADLRIGGVLAQAAEVVAQAGFENLSPIQRDICSPDHWLALYFPDFIFSWSCCGLRLAK